MYPIDDHNNVPDALTATATEPVEDISEFSTTQRLQHV